VIPRGDLAADEKATISLFENSSPSVVFITSLAVQQELFSLNVQEIPRGAGSGFVWDTAGHVVTNFHVADHAGLRGTRRDTWGRWTLGDVIVGLDGKPVRSSGDILVALETRKAGDKVKLEVIRDGRKAGATVTLSPATEAAGPDAPDIQ
jgi:S1-C subfamily serine protease